MGAVLFILRSQLLLYSTGSGVNRVQVVLSGLSVRLFCFAQAKTLCRRGCNCIGCARACVCGCDVNVISVDHLLNGCGCVWYVCCYIRKKALVVVYPLP